MTVAELSDETLDEWRDESARQVGSPAVERTLDSRIVALIDALRAEREKVERVETLFSGGPDTSCRTTWRNEHWSYAIECVEVPVAALRAALGTEGD